MSAEIEEAKLRAERVRHQPGQGSSTAAVTTASYDALGRTTKVQDGGAGYVTLNYNQNDILQISGPAPSGENLKQKQLEYDGIGRLTSVCEITTGTTKDPSGGCGQNTAASGYLTTYVYGVNSSNLPMTTVTQNAQPGSSGQQQRVFVFDLLGRLVSETNPETGNQAPGTTNYTYDTDPSGACPGTYNGDLVKKVDNRGNITCYTYDSLHRVQSVSYTSGSPDYANTPPKSFVYDAATYNSTAMANAKGRLAEAYTGLSSSKITDEFFSYSKRGELTDTYQFSPNSGTPYYHATVGFWANGAVNSLALVSPANLFPSQTIGVDGEGRPSSVTANSTQNANVVSSTTYDLVNYQTTLKFGSGDSDVFTMDPNSGRLKQYTFNVGGNADVGTLTWNPSGSLGALNIVDSVPGTSDSQSCSYIHDDMSRIASVNCGNSIWRQSFSYDPFGNISKDSTGYTGDTFLPGYSNITNQFTSLPGATPTYDTDGRLTYDGFNHYTWDADSKLHTVDTSPTTTATYDALGRMVEKQVGAAYTQIVYSPLGTKLALMNGQTLQKAFVPLPAGATAVYTSSGLAYYRHPDYLSSSRLATTPSQTLYTSTAYAPFGEMYNPQNPTDSSFAGMDQDTESGMRDTLMRRYMPVQGRWLTPDPAGLLAVDPSSPQTWNRYAYVVNNPLSFVDPLGLQLGYCTANGVQWDSADSEDVSDGQASCQDSGGTWTNTVDTQSVTVDGGSTDGVVYEWDPFRQDYIPTGNVNDNLGGTAGRGAPSNGNTGLTLKQIKCGALAGLPVAIDAASLVADFAGPEGQAAKIAVGFGLSLAATFTSAANGDTGGALWGAASFTRAPLEVATKAMGPAGLAQWIPGVGAVGDGIAAIHDISGVSGSYSACMAKQ